MSDDEAHRQESEDDGDEDLGVDEVDVRDALRAALQVPPPDDIKIARGVQRRIREKTAGRYFSDGWSTSTEPRNTYLVTAALMLALVLLAWWLLAPSGFVPWPN